MEPLEWMHDPSLKNIEKRKLNFIQKLFFEAKTLNDEEKLPFFLALATRAQKENISFSNDETQQIINVLKRNSTDAELDKINMILSKYKSSK